MKKAIKSYLNTVNRNREVEYVKRFPNDELLLNGYIRMAQKNEELKEIIIPTVINQLCFKFYHIPLDCLMRIGMHCPHQANKRIIREYLRMKKKPNASFVAGPINEDSSNSLSNWRDNLFDWNGNLLPWKALILGPTNSPYDRGEFALKIVIPTHYPFEPPKFTFMTKIFHCNINQKRICLEKLHQHHWAPSITIQRILHHIVDLMREPNPNEPLVTEIAKLYQADRSQHNKICREWTVKYAQPDVANKRLSNQLHL